MRCSAERPRTSNSVRSGRTRWTRLSSCTDPRRRLRAGVQRDAGVARQVRASARSTTWSANSASMVGAVDVELREPGPVVSVASSLRYSSASRPTIEAFSRSGRSLVTRTTSRPSLARLRATARMRWSLLSWLSDAGSPAVSVWLSSTRRVPPCSLAGIGPEQRPVLEAQVLEHPQGPAGRPAQLGVVPLALQLREHHEREDHLVLVEALERPGIGQQHRGVEHVGPACLGAAGALSPPGAATGPDPRRVRPVRTGAQQEGCRSRGSPPG